MQAYLISNNLANDFRNDTKESDPMEVDCIVTLSMVKKTKRQKKKEEAKWQKGNDKDQGKDRGVDAKPDAQVKECYVCGKKGHFAQDYFSRIHHDKTVNELQGARVAADAAKKNVYTNGNTVNHEAALIMFDTEVSVNVCSSWLGEPALEQPDGSVRFRGADGRTNIPRARKATDLVENRKSAEKIKVPCGGRDKTDPECQLLLRKRN